MNLVWKLLRQHISIPQFAGFAFANLFGMLIVLFGFQFYQDVLPVFTQQDSFMKADYLIMSKKIGMGNTISGRTNTFSGSEIDDVSSQKFVKKVGKFTSTEYKVDASMGVNGVNVLNSELFFESVPDGFVDVPLKDWKYEPGFKEVPIMKTSSYSIFDFLEACGRNWRNTVCVSCEHCFQPCRAECRGCLLTADMEGRPMAISLTRFEAITGWKVEPCDCIGTLSRYAFDELFRYYRLWECADPVACLLCYLDSNISAAPNSKREQVNPSYDAAPWHSSS